jgi:hypothetical protein
LLYVEVFISIQLICCLPSWVDCCVVHRSCF